MTVNPEINPEIDFPWRPSFTTKARCLMCSHCLINKLKCSSGHKLVYPLIAGIHGCTDYDYIPELIEIPTPEHSYCLDCSHWFFGCQGIKWRPVKLNPRCEFFRNMNLTCNNSIPMLQYGDHHRNNYCKCPPEHRDGDSSRGWQWLCPYAHRKQAAELKCYVPLKKS